MQLVYDIVLREIGARCSPFCGGIVERIIVRDIFYSARPLRP
jgi:hypothetical protein